MQFIYATWPSIVNYIYRSFFIATSLLRIITIETAFRYSLRRYFAFHSFKWITMGNTSTRLFINNLDNRYNYVNLTEGKRRVSTLLLSGRKKHRIRSTEQQPYNVSFFSLSLSPFVYALRRLRSQFKTRFAFFYEFCYLGRERRDSYRFLASFLPSFFRRVSNEIVEKITSIFEILFDYQKKKKTNSIKNDSLYIYI